MFLLAAGSFVIVRRSEATAQAKEDVVAAMLKLPAPPPPNPWMRNTSRDRKFDKNNPPDDDAPIEDLMDYWRAQSSNYRDLGNNIRPSSRSLDRILAEIEKDPTSVTEYLNIMRDSPQGADFAKRIYDNWPGTEGEERYERGLVKKWLIMNSPFYTSQLAGPASRAADANQYVSNQDELLALSKYDWERARPIVDRMYGDLGQPVSRVLATWALYKHALEEGAIGDTDRYRDELKAVVEDKKATDGMRDLAFDALVKEKDWSGRDEWYFSLLEDETLADLRVNGSSYTGLTTIVIYSPPEKYADKMIELVKSKNPTVRNAAARNLGVILDNDRPEVARALLPWLEDPKWATDIGRGTRQRLVQILQTLKMPESVPGLIAMLDEKESQDLRIPFGRPGSNSNTGANAAMRAAANGDLARDGYVRSANMAANAANYAANAVSNSGSYRTISMATTPYRGSAIQALGMQGDMRAAPALRRLIPEMGGYELTVLVKALFQCHGFTVAEQLDAVETALRQREADGLDADTATVYSNAANTAYTVSNIYPSLPARPATVKSTLGSLIIESGEVSDDLVRAVIDRISYYDTRDPKLAASLRSLLLKWKGTAVNALLLRDLKAGRSSTAAVIKLLTIRKELREKQPNDVYDLRTGVPAAVGISSCLLENESDYAGMLASENTETRSAMLACARMIRAKLPVQAVAANLRSPDKRLVLAAESYLESEDSPEARSFVLSVHPSEAKILGATTAFMPAGSSPAGIDELAELFISVNDNIAAFFRGEYNSSEIDGTETRLQKEVIEIPDLLGLYSYDDNFIRIYKDKAVFSWEEGETRYRERTLSPDEFENFKGFLARYRVDELPPFLDCSGESECDTNELLMIGKGGGRRVFLKSSRKPPFFAELEGLLEQMRTQPAKLHYWLEKDIPGLEILFADENLSAKTVWKNGADIRLLIEDKPRGRAVEREIENAAETMAEDDTDGPADIESRINEIREKRQYENYTWFNFGQGRLGEPAAQPEQAEFIPARDGITPPAAAGAWKARGSGVEVRRGDDGLYKIAGGRATKIRDGNYYSPVVTQNGRWLLATKYTEGEDTGLVRINLLTNKEFKVMFGEERLTRAIVFVPGQNKALVTVVGEEEYAGQDDEGGEGDEVYSRPQYWLDVETGVVRPAGGELRPLLQQAFRPLQPAANAFEFWAAIPNSGKNETAFGIYNTRTLKFAPRLRLPKINFNSMDIWADEPGGKLYFTYEGHLLAVPLK